MFIHDSDLSNSKMVGMPREMAEGWGLTHDDNYLIASDGTN